MGLQQKLDALEAETYGTEPLTVEDEAERLLSYWHQHGNNPEAVTKWAVADLLAFVRLAAPDAAAHYGQAPWETDPTATPDAEPAPVWPENADERASFADWQREVGEGDTTRGFRDWLAANAESEDGDTEPETDENDERGDICSALREAKYYSLANDAGKATLDEARDAYERVTGKPWSADQDDAPPMAGPGVLVRIDTADSNLPVVIERGDDFPFEPGERDLFRPATAAEYARYVRFYTSTD